jgi:signal transduction histidine kinase
MTDKPVNSGDRRAMENRRSGEDRRSAKDRRSGTDRRSGKDRRSGWGPIKDQRFQGVLKATTTVSHLFAQPLTVITGYVDLLTASTKEENTKEKLSIIKDQLEVINKYLNSLRNLREYKTVDFAGVTLLDIDPSDTKKE